MWKERSPFEILTDKLVRKRLLGRSGVYERIIVEWISKNIDVNTGKWIDWAQDKGYYRALVSSALNYRIP